jgi:hypothetical protein
MQVKKAALLKRCNYNSAHNSAKAIFTEDTTTLTPTPTKWQPNLTLTFGPP